MVEQWSDAFGGIETKGLLKGPVYQIFESNGTLLQTRFVLNPDF